MRCQACDSSDKVKRVKGGGEYCPECLNAIQETLLGYSSTPSDNLDDLYLTDADLASWIEDKMREHREGIDDEESKGEYNGD